MVISLAEVPSRWKIPCEVTISDNRFVFGYEPAMHFTSDGDTLVTPHGTATFSSPFSKLTLTNEGFSPNPSPEIVSSLPPYSEMKVP